MGSRATGALATTGAHPAADLTVDHIVPLAAGGAPFDISATALCSVGRATVADPTLTNLTVVEPSLEEAFLALTIETTTEREAAA